MSNVLIEKNKLDILANAISNKSGEPLKLTLDEMVEAVDGIETGGGEPNLQSKTYTVSAAGTETIEADNGYDGLSEVEVTVPSGLIEGYTNSSFVTESGVRKWKIRAGGEVLDGGYFATGTIVTDLYNFNAIPTGTTVTPTESAQTIGGANYMMEGAVTVNAVQSGSLYTHPFHYEDYDCDNLQISVDADSGVVDAYMYNANIPMVDVVESAGWLDTNASALGFIGIDNKYQLPTQAGTTITPTESAQTAVAKGKFTTGAVTVNAIPSNYVGSGITQRSSTDLTVSGATVTAPSGYYSASASKSVASGTAGTPTATKGTVSNHSVSVTPSVTNTTGYITGGTKSGTAVSVSASELVSGSETKTQNGTYDVTNLAEIVVDVQGGGGGGTLKNGVIRPDAELVQTWSSDTLLIEDDGISIGTYSTSQKTLKTSYSLQPTATLDFNNYNYYVLERALAIPIYSNSTARAGKEEYFIESDLVEIAYFDRLKIKGLSTDRYISTSTNQVVSTNVRRLIYWSSALNLGSVNGNYGVFTNLSAPTISGTTLTVKSHAVYIKGNSSYFNSTAWGEMTDIRFQYIIELYRSPKNNLGVDGWGNQSQFMHIANDIIDNNGTLT